MARVEYDRDELDMHYKIMNGIAKTLAGSHRGTARTTLQAVNALEVVDDEGRAVDVTLEVKIAYVCSKLNCTHERVSEANKIVFTRRGK